MTLTKEMLEAALDSIGEAASAGEILGEVIRVDPDERSGTEFNEANARAQLQHYWSGSLSPTIYQGPPDLFVRIGGIVGI